MFIDLIDLIYPKPLALEPGRAEARADPKVAEVLRLGPIAAVKGEGGCVVTHVPYR